MRGSRLINGLGIWEGGGGGGREIVGKAGDEHDNENGGGMQDRNLEELVLRRAVWPAQ